MKEYANQQEHKAQTTKESLSVSDIIFPEKYTKPLIVIYLLLLPFIVGHIFLFTYVSKFNFEIYSAICTENNGFLTWCMGYESFAVLLALILVIAFIFQKVNLTLK
jgi:hypothetical protein